MLVLIDKLARRHEAKGDMILMRHADDIVVGFEHEIAKRQESTIGDVAMGAAQFCPWCVAAPACDMPAGPRQAGTPRRLEHLVHQLR